MSIADSLEAHTRLTKQRNFKLDRIIAELPEDDSKALLEALEGTSVWSPGSICKALMQNDYDICENAVRNYRVYKGWA